MTRSLDDRGGIQLKHDDNKCLKSFVMKIDMMSYPENSCWNSTPKIITLISIAIRSEPKRDCQRAFTPNSLM